MGIKPADNPRNVKTFIRLTESEHSALIALATKERLKLASYIQQVLLKHIINKSSEVKSG